MFRSRFDYVVAFALAAALVACKSSDENAQPGTDSGFPPCVEDWCATLTPGCEKFSTLCFPSYSEGTRRDAVKGCAEELGAPIRAGTSASTPQQFADCMAKASTCIEAMGCSEPIMSPQRDAGPPPTSPPDAGWTPPSTWDPLPGDDPGCVECAATKCPSESPHCFEQTKYLKECTPDGGKYADCCRDYRGCLAECRQGDPTGGSMFVVCASGCDTDYPGGRKEFNAFQACMTMNCATCATKDGGV